MATTTLTPTSATAETPKPTKKGSISEMKTPLTPTQTTFGCQHIKRLLQAARTQATEGYARIIQALGKDDNSCDRTHKSGAGTDTIVGVTYLCLQCPSIGVGRERHRKDHAFSVESSNGSIYCHECRDFVYDPTFEEIRTSNNAISKKRKHSTFASSEDRKFVSTNTATIPCAATGLRGLYNMGQTCFMSVILQSLVHNPLIRSYFLSEGHKSSDCEREACTSCALDDIFTDFYGQEKHEGYGAVHMLQGCWKGGGGLAGYSQQDAHEFLNFFINSLHTAITETDEAEDEENNNKTEAKQKAAEKDAKDCSCIIHTAFSGLLTSTVTCTACRNVTTALDPFLDLSLDIRSAAVSVKKKKLTMINGTTTVREVLPMDLTECLDRFTSAETLSADSYHCRKCDKNQEATKKLSLGRLPPVVAVHLKRFSHSKSLSQSTKIETKIRYPLTADFTPYLTTPVPSNSGKNKPKPQQQATGHAPDDEASAADTVDSSAYTPSDPIYELSSVVVHKGKIDNGHYVSYSRQAEHEWYRFDDSMVVQVDEKEALSAEAYMLFYVARGLDM
ncbi:hypothetical protein BAUCODRAFT_63002 [Baudoinia panamericana UAMH 10762]|uniref:Ubiquitin carboxyl-terminal hydrolase n=1 Tax=Baudoinia panamericana (strain UAMH 10762) TaxID=717646 RepID=M2NKJ6_BAUPA|nr:uncharacterized protein BAUCODRAFT_63002 [Baudoinia panamericana UAMH 10762]EMC99959.1 hypothetical protein BAUCODRAFT_63002 [Baudoinia panamericana UAMH 10762]